MNPTHPLLILNLSGTQAEMGRQHGELLRRHGGHESTLGYYPNMPFRLLTAGGRSSAEKRALNASKPLMEWVLRRLDRDRPVELRDRAREFAAAVGLPADDARYFAVMDLFQNVVGSLARVGLLGPARRVATAVPPACSSLAAWGSTTEDGRLLHARNFDFPGVGIWEQAPTLVFCTPPSGLRYGFATTRGADVPGVTAFNEAGLTLTAHTRFHRDVGLGRAIVDLGHEIIRRARTLDEAVAIAGEVRVASTWGLLVSSAESRSAVLIETTAAGVVATWPGDGEPFLACTNHYVHPALQVDEVSPSAAWLQHCFGRYAVLRGRARAGGLDVDGMRALLGSHLDPETGAERGAGGVIAQPVTVQSIVADPERRQLWLSVGGCPTGRNAFACVDWVWSSEPGSREVEPTPEPARPSRYTQGEGGRAWSRYLEACRLGEHGADVVEQERCLLEAVEADPTEPTWRFLAGSMRLRHGASAEALGHYEIGLAHEQASFYRGQLLLWASRAAQDAGRVDRARELRRELLGLGHPLLGGYRTAALAEDRRPPREGRWRGIPIHLELVDAG